MTAKWNITTLQTQTVGACCTTLYDHPLASWLTGDSLHPGGLQLTDEIASLAGVGIDTRLLDVGCGHGASAIYLASTRCCDVTGITLEPAGVEAAVARAKEQGQEGVRFEQADITSYSPGDARFDAVLMECVLSTVGSKEEALRWIYELLSPGGRIAFSDVTVNGELPSDIAGPVASALCIGDARSLDEYADLMLSTGFNIITKRDVEDVAIRFVRRVSTMLMAADVAVGLGKLNVSRDSMKQLRRFAKAVRTAVEDGVVGYCVIVAERPR